MSEKTLADKLPVAPQDSNSPIIRLGSRIPGATGGWSASVLRDHEKKQVGWLPFRCLPF